MTTPGDQRDRPRQARPAAGPGDGRRRWNDPPRARRYLPALKCPARVLPAAVAEDFSPWRNIERELTEELLGHDEYDGSGHPIAYNELEPFATLDRSYSRGDIRVCLGVTLDALTLCGDILTVAVIEPDLYDTLFSGAVSSNSEGTVSARALPSPPHQVAKR